MRDDGRPVAYDPCRTIRYVVNPASMPFEGDRTLGLSIMRISGLTGLRFEQVGTTDEVDDGQRSPYQPDRYGEAWAPVLIWWATPEEAPQLEGDIVGYAASTSFEWRDDDGMAKAYVTGVVVLDGPDLAQLIIRGRRGEEQARAIVMHELGHLLGLDHVDDPAQLMFPRSNPAVLDFAPGDIEGLRQLGSGDCFTDI